MEGAADGLAGQSVPAAASHRHPPACDPPQSGFRAAAPSRRRRERAVGRKRSGRAALRRELPTVTPRTKGRQVMRIRRPSHRNAHTFLIHVFGQGLDGERYVVERFRSRPDGRIDPVEAGQPKANRGGRKPRRTIVSASEIRTMRPERDEIIVCTALDLKASDVQIWGWQATGILATRRGR